MLPFKNFRMHLSTLSNQESFFRIRVKSAPSQVGPGQLGRDNSAGSIRPVWGPRYGGKVVRLGSGCICMSICISVNTYLNFSATLEVSSLESLMAYQRSFNHVLNQPIKIQIFNALAVVQLEQLEQLIWWKTNLVLTVIKELAIAWILCGRLHA